MRVLVFGANGQVGYECVNKFRQAGFELIALTRQQADLSKPEQVGHAVKDNKPQLVVNAAAYTAVDKAEAEPELAALINHYSVQATAQACRELGIPLFHISTDYVFDGSKEGGYHEKDPVSPLGVYGQTKLAGEQAIQQEHAEHIILRTSWVFGRHGQNFVKTMLRLGAERESLGVVVDQRGCPTYAGDIAGAFLRAAIYFREQGALPWGLYHYSGDTPCSWYEFALKVFEYAKEQGLLSVAPTVNPIASREYPTPAKRPANSTLDCTKILSTGLGIGLSDWEARLGAVLAENLA